ELDLKGEPARFARAPGGTLERDGGEAVVVLLFQPARSSQDVRQVAVELDDLLAAPDDAHGGVELAAAVGDGAAVLGEQVSDGVEIARRERRHEPPERGAGVLPERLGRR